MHVIWLAFDSGLLVALVDHNYAFRIFCSENESINRANTQANERFDSLDHEVVEF